MPRKIYLRLLSLPLLPLTSTPSNILSISLRISRRFAFRVFTSSNFLCTIASSTKVSNKASCSSNGCNACARSESGSTSGSLIKPLSAGSSIPVGLLFLGCVEPGKDCCAWWAGSNGIKKRKNLLEEGTYSFARISWHAWELQLEYALGS